MSCDDTARNRWQGQCRTTPGSREESAGAATLDSTKIGTVRRYLEAVGGRLAIEYVIGDQRIQVT
ncbi:hypothetical protein AB0Y14_02750 [Rothia sp. HC945]|uniref:hypothetical protein n=1 Tax=Rothia sp. HC945 TaxID=3171170 RepID=UPI0026539000|nr:hypothetical protein [Kocuria sp.]MDN5617372.1 hypothetical protein [Kocuria sp.]MDN5653765.1 hypothetical protein [Kocuria sp.]